MPISLVQSQVLQAELLVVKEPLHSCEPVVHLFRLIKLFRITKHNSLKAAALSESHTGELFKAEALGVASIAYLKGAEGLGAGIDQPR